MLLFFSLVFFPFTTLEFFLPKPLIVSVRTVAWVPCAGGQNQTLHPHQQKLLSNKVKFPSKV